MSICHHPVSEVKAVANQLLDWSDEDSISMSPMKLQKILFFLHADFIIDLDQPLIAQTFEAWEFGPVEPSIYHEFKVYGRAAITSRAQMFSPLLARRVLPTLKLPPIELAFLRDLFDFYKYSSAVSLSELSHISSGPWCQALSLFSNGRNMDRRISTNLIKAFHRRRSPV